MNIGDPVRVGHHWLRGKHEGTLLAYDTADDLWVVGFTRRWVGGGYDDAAFPGVQCLRLAENQLSNVPNNDAPTAPNRQAADTTSQAQTASETTPTSKRTRHRRPQQTENQK